jgi:hypothetical protein
MNRKLHNLFFLQLLNISSYTNVDKCINEMDKVDINSVRVVLLQTEQHRIQIRDFGELLINRVLRHRKVHVEEKFLNDSATKWTGLGPVKSHLVVAWNEQALNRFLDINHEIVVPKARQFYKIFFVEDVPISSKTFVRFWQDFGVLDVCFCERGTHYVFWPFIDNVDGTWGSLTTHTSANRDNFNGFPLKICMFSRPPTATVEIPKLLKFNPIYANLPPDVIVGLDGLIIQTMAENLNFRIDMVGGLGPENFGWVMSNGTVTGTLGTIANRQAHISTNGRFIMNYGTTEIEFTIPYETDAICAIVPKSKRVPQWVMIFICFDDLTWVAVYFVFVVCTVLWYFSEPTKECMLAVWEMYCIFRGIPVKIVPTIGQMFFLVWCMLFSIIILSLIQGSYFKAFTTPTFYKEIDTLEELDATNFPIASNFYRFDNDGSELIARLKKKRIKSQPQLFDAAAYSQNLAKLERKRDLESFVKTHYLDEDGTPLLHIVNECFTSYFISYIVPRGSALLHIFDKVIVKFVESGLTSKWYRDIEDSMLLERLINLNKNKTLWAPFNLRDLQGAFFVWMIMSLFTVLVFFSEVLLPKKYLSAFFSANK